MARIRHVSNKKITTELIDSLTLVADSIGEDISTSTQIVAATPVPLKQMTNLAQMCPITPPSTPTSGSPPKAPVLKPRSFPTERARFMSPLTLYYPRA